MSTTAVSIGVQRLLDRGVVIPAPASVEVDDAIAPDRIAPGVRIHAGSRIRGAETSIGPGCVIGSESPATVEDCQLGRKVELKGGYFAGAVFLDGAGFGSGGHVRPGTILEEEASGAHTVGLKQTIFLPFVTAGSLVNFCDALMSGGTSRKHHSEIGSSYIHFNFTPHGDKATASLIGDVPRGVMLDQSPIFLGGQGGLVGPTRVGYGAVIPAGIVLRKDALEENCLHYGGPLPIGKGARSYFMGVYGPIQRIVRNNLIYIGNIKALQAWYRWVRPSHMESDPFQRACLEGARRQLNAVMKERVKRLRELAEKMRASIEIAARDMNADPEKEPYLQQQKFMDRWPDMSAHIERVNPVDAEAALRDAFLNEWAGATSAASHTDAVRALSPDAKRAGAAWLQAIVDSVSKIWHA